MPDDPLIPQQGAPQNAAPASPGVDAETLQKLVAQAVEPHAAQHRAEMETMREQNESLARELAAVRQQSAAPTPAPYEEPSSDDTLTSFMADPNAFIAEAVSRAIDPKFQEFAGQMAPIVGKFNDMGGKTLTQHYRNEIDSEFGAGTFEEQFSPLLKLRLKQETEGGQPLRASDDAWMGSEMKAIKGELFDELTERRETHQKAVADGTQKQTEELVSRVTTNLGTGGFSNKFFQSEDADPTPDQQAFLDSRARSMGKREKGMPSFNEMKDIGNYANLDDYKEALAAKANGSTGGTH